MTAWIDGQIVGADVTPMPSVGVVAPFETMGAQRGEVALWREHLVRLSATAVRLGLTFAPGPELRAAASDLLLRNGDTEGVLRLMLLPKTNGVSVVLTSRPRGPLKSVRLLPTVVERPSDAPPADLKTFPRHFYDAVLQQAQDGGADDGIVIGR
ncbi:MAG: aminotransferase class IV, partial [Planctomycetota bacterium]